MVNEFTLSFPAIRAVQARREYYVIMCPLKHIPKIFTFDDAELSPEIRAQRILNKSRIPNLAKYIVDNPEDYVFSAITASIDGDVIFDALGDSEEETTFGMLKISLGAKFIINDGQHRRAAIEQAVNLEPKLGNDSIAVVLFLDKGLERSQQMFSDLNRHAIRPSRSLGLLYDHRNDMAKIAKLMALKSKAFQGLVDLEKSSLSERSRKLFTLSSIYTGCQSLLEHSELTDFENASALCFEFWDEISLHFRDWQDVREGKVTSGEIRKDKIHSHAIALQCLGIIGSELVLANPKAWKAPLEKLRSIDWFRGNASIWEGRALVGGRVSKTTGNVILMTNYIKKMLSLKLTPEQLRLENLYLKGANGN
ncbi:DNA sulfur modification protein DndB [Nitrosomonadales bacterium]|nr:DNA sulfur modification protein DndB [Nitrosomonadales bacterium]